MVRATFIFPLSRWVIGRIDVSNPIIYFLNSPGMCLYGGMEVRCQHPECLLVQQIAHSNEKRTNQGPDHAQLRSELFERGKSILKKVSSEEPTRTTQPDPILRKPS